MVLQIIKSLIKLIGLIAVVYILLTELCTLYTIFGIGETVKVKDCYNRGSLLDYRVFLVWLREEIVN